MLSKEQIDRLDELAAKATPGPWFKNNRCAIGPRSTEEDQSYGMVIPVAFADVVDSDGGEIRNAEFIAAANPQAVSELIAMLRESQKELSFQIAEHQREYDLRIEAQKDAARYLWIKENSSIGFQLIDDDAIAAILFETPVQSLKNVDYAIDAAMQRDCDETKIRLLDVNSLIEGKIYYIAGNGMCEYIGLDHYRGETTCKFRRVELASNHRDFYYERLDCVPSRIFLNRNDFDAYHKQRDCDGAQHAKDSE